MGLREVIFPSSDGLALEGVLHLPVPVGPPEGNGWPGVVVCHPHPLYGGNMHNLVAAGVCRELSRRGLVALRFNFRGVGASQGSYGEGLEEQKDVQGAIVLLAGLREVDPGRIGLAGYSFGAYVGLKTGAQDGRVKALAAIAPPIVFSDLSFLKECSKPKFFIFGSGDEITPLEPFLALFRQLPGENSYRVVQGADHYLLGYEGAVAEQVAEHLAQIL